jgi:hypothetical protein
MEVYNNYFNREKFNYLPTKADFIQITVIKMIMYVHMIFMLSNAYNVGELNAAIGAEYTRIDNILYDNATLYIDVQDKLELLRYFAIVIVLSPWSKGFNVDKNKTHTMNL